ncbi:hypothetical protein MKX01_041273, partial [Papaver californicum]
SGNFSMVMKMLGIFDGDKIVWNEPNPALAYAFDKVFGPATEIQVVYEIAARPVIESAMTLKLSFSFLKLNVNFTTVVGSGQDASIENQLSSFREDKQAGKA